MSAAIDTSSDHNELLARDVVATITEHLETLFATYKLRAPKGSVLAIVEKRFLGWRKHPDLAVAFRVWARASVRGGFVSAAEVSRTLGRKQKYAAKMFTQLARWRVVALDESGGKVVFQPFKRGREIHPCERKTLSDGTLARGGMRLVLQTRTSKPLGHDEARAIGETILPGMRSDFENFDGAAEAYKADPSITDAQRADWDRLADQMRNPIVGPVNASQLPLFASAANDD